MEIVSNSYDALMTLHKRQKHKEQKQPTLVLIDMDENIANQEIHSRECLGLIKSITQELNQGNLHDAIPIGKSKNNIQNPIFIYISFLYISRNYVIPTTPQNNLTRLRFHLFF